MNKYLFILVFLISLYFNPANLLIFSATERHNVLYAAETEEDVSLDDIKSEHIKLGLINLSENNFKGAEKELKKAIQEDPKDYLSYYALGTVYLTGLDQVNKSISVFRKGISRIGYNKKLYFGLAMAYLKKKDLDNSEKALKTILGHEPDEDSQYALETVRILQKEEKKNWWLAGLLEITALAVALYVIFFLRTIRKHEVCLK